MALLTPGLDRNAEMQRQPLGTFSALRRPSPVASQYKRQAEMYGQALRTLSRAARRGDVKSALTAIDVRDKANAEGFSPGGISRSEDTLGNIAGRERDYAIGAQDYEHKSALDRRFGESALGRPVPMAPSREVSAPAGSPDNVRQRIDLFNEMKTGMAGSTEGSPYYLDSARERAQSLGIDDAGFSRGRDLADRQNLDAKLRQAKTPQEIEELKRQGGGIGISPAAFDRRARWWDSNR